MTSIQPIERQETATIVLDCRESQLIALLPSLSTQQLPVGDIWIGSPETTEHGVVIERKTVADLESSLTDGRYREQRTRLLAFCAEKKARALYILEGSLQTIQPPKKRVLWQVLTRLSLRYGVGVLYTTSVRETADLVEVIAYQLSQDRNCFKADTLSYSDVTSFTKKGNKDDSENYFLAAMQQCNGVSLEKARAILQSVKGFQGLLAMSEADLANISIKDKRHLGPVLAKRIYSHFHFSLQK